jgi:hypothetical protein
MFDALSVWRTYISSNTPETSQVASEETKRCRMKHERNHKPSEKTPVTCPYARLSPFVFEQGMELSNLLLEILDQSTA